MAWVEYNNDDKDPWAPKPKQSAWNVGVRYFAAVVLFGAFVVLAGIGIGFLIGYATTDTTDTTTIECTK